MGYRLTVVFKGKTVERREVDKARFVIGRSRETDLVIDNLGVSRAHTEILFENGAAVLRDLNSNNGTFVNGRRVTKHHLNDGDEIAMGKFLITFQGEERDDEEEEVEPEEAKGGGEHTIAIDSRLMEQRQRERASKLKAYLVHGGSDQRRTIVLDRSVFTIGKASSTNLRVGGFFTAKKHCIIFRDETSFRLIDTSQKGRTLLNEMSIDDERLKDGDTIRIGRNKLKFMVGVPAV